MKKIALSIFLLCLTIIGFAQSRSATLCRLGLQYEISRSPNWGTNKPVIQSIIPYSSAETAGLKPGDIIEAIDGVPVGSVLPEELPQLLNPVDKNEVILTIRNLANPEKQVRVRKECKKSNTITEDQLASAFNMYSLETTSERLFICPFKTTVTSDPADFSTFRTYAFAPIDENNRVLETAINEYIGKILSAKGLTPDPENPDIEVHTFYYFDRNPNFRGRNPLVVAEKETIYRYNITHSKMETFPFLSPLSAESEAEYLLQLGVRMIDQRDSPGRVLWECEANELLEKSYRLEDYALTHIPLMFMQFPYVKYTRNVPFYVSKKTYNYTGIQFDIDRMELVADVDRSSPAYAAGIRAGDVIERIGKHKMNNSTENFTIAYKRFITKTMDLRDPKTMFTDANGFRYCMYWDTFKYTQVADALQQNAYQGAFSYLYYFAPYVNPSGNNACVFQIKRGKEKNEITIRPTIRSESIIEIQ